MPGNTPLSPSVVADIINCYAELGSARKVVKALGVSKPTVLRYLRINGIDPASVIYQPLEIRPLDAAWMAGFFDGEGHVEILKSCQEGVDYYKVRVILVNAHHESIYEIKKLINGGSIRLVEKSKQNPKWSDVSVLQLSGRAVIAFLKAIQLYSRTKRQHINLALEFYQKRVSMTKEEQSQWRFELRLLSRNSFTKRKLG